jgi:hypothetical protein
MHSTLIADMTSRFGSLGVVRGRVGEEGGGHTAAEAPSVWQQAQGTTDALQVLGQQYGMAVDVIDLVDARAVGVVGSVSSSKVREALKAGRMGLVADWLGRPHRLVADTTTPSPSACIRCVLSVHAAHAVHSVHQCAKMTRCSTSNT